MAAQLGGAESGLAGDDSSDFASVPADSAEQDLPSRDWSEPEAGSRSLTVGSGEDIGFLLTEDNSSHVMLDGDGGVVLESSDVKLGTLWISNTGENTVSKIDCATGKETARYAVCSNPSRTAVDMYGDTWVGCRDDGGVAKIMAEEGRCEDKDGNGQKDTSTDIDGSGRIEPDEMPDKGTDECLAFITYPGGSCQRALGVDKQNHAWTGDWNGGVLRRLAPEDGSVVEEIQVPVNPYGLVIDKNGIIWVSGRGGGKLVRVDPSTESVQSFQPDIGCFEPYGITLDYKGRVWLANCCCSNVAYRYDPQNGLWQAASAHSRPRGIAADTYGRVFVANDDDSQVTVVHADSAGTIGHVELGEKRFPVGITVDFEGYVWTVNHNSSSTSKIDPKALQVVGEYPTGSYPYTYSDMAGYALHTVTSPGGSFVQVFGDGGGVVKWVAVDVVAFIPAGASIKVRVRTAKALQELDQAPWSGYSGPFPPAEMPIDLVQLGLTGAFLAVEVSLLSDGGSGSPTISAIEAVFEHGDNNL